MFGTYYNFPVFKPTMLLTYHSTFIKQTKGLTMLRYRYKDSDCSICLLSFMHFQVLIFSFVIFRCCQLFIIVTPYMVCEYQSLDF